ncbi:hypothetical protein C2G38_2044650 [Gigaspora rosea]|uniref:Uncharacterized protein n=1 Tax=Gigaspora rosea TaxID=44941 RepID=A0A397UPH6_9GLOM|nr:hypothetical protein C2G38_2044650 [Gigaspora rosea]
MKFNYFFVVIVLVLTILNAYTTVAFSVISPLEERGRNRFFDNNFYNKCLLNLDVRSIIFILIILYLMINILTNACVKLLAAAGFGMAICNLIICYYQIIRKVRSILTVALLNYWIPPMLMKFG